jgi:hypothetical protein
VFRCPSFRYLICGFHFFDLNLTFQVWSSHCSFALIFSALFIKTYRVGLIFNQAVLRKLHLSNARMFLGVLLVLLLEGIYLTCWTSIDPPALSCSIVQPTNQMFCSCDITHSSSSSSSAWSFWHPVLLGLEALGLLFGVYLCILTRKIPTQFNESKKIALILAFTFVITLVTAPISLNLSGDSPLLQFCVRVFAPLLIGLVSSFVSSFSSSCSFSCSLVTWSAVCRLHPVHPKDV